MNSHDAYENYIPEKYSKEFSQGIDCAVTGVELIYLNELYPINQYWLPLGSAFVFNFINDQNFMFEDAEYEFEYRAEYNYKNHKNKIKETKKLAFGFGIDYYYSEDEQYVLPFHEYRNIGEKRHIGYYFYDRRLNHGFTPYPTWEHNRNTLYCIDYGNLNIGKFKLMELCEENCLGQFYISERSDTLQVVFQKAIDAVFLKMLLAEYA